MAANKNAKKLQKSKPIERSEEKTKLISLSTISTILIGKSLKSIFFVKMLKSKQTLQFDIKICIFQVCSLVDFICIMYHHYTKTIGVSASYQQWKEK